MKFHGLTVLLLALGQFSESVTARLHVRQEHTVPPYPFEETSGPHHHSTWHRTRTSQRPLGTGGLPFGHRTSTGRHHTSTGRPHPTTGRHHTSTGRPHPTTGRHHTSMGRPHPTTGRHHTSTGRPHPTTGRHRPSTGRPHPTTGRPHPTTGRPHPTGAHHTSTGARTTHLPAGIIIPPSYSSRPSSTSSSAAPKETKVVSHGEMIAVAAGSGLAILGGIGGGLIALAGGLAAAGGAAAGGVAGAAAPVAIGAGEVMKAGADGLTKIGDAVTGGNGGSGNGGNGQQNNGQKNDGQKKNDLTDISIDPMSTHPPSQPTSAIPTSAIPTITTPTTGPASEPTTGPTSEPTTATPTATHHSSHRSTPIASTTHHSSHRSTPTASTTHHSSHRSTTTGAAAPVAMPGACLIFPPDNPSDQQKKDFLALLDKTLGGAKAYRKTDDGVFLLVAATLTAAQQASLSKSPLVGAIESDDAFGDDGRIIKSPTDPHSGRPSTSSNGGNAFSARNDPNAGKPAVAPRAKSLVFKRDHSEQVDDPTFDASIDEDPVDRRRAHHPAQRLRSRSPVLSKRGVMRQSMAPADLTMLGQAKGSDRPLSYRYDASAGAGITVYVLDTGYYARSPEIKELPIKARWLYAGSQAALAEKSPVQEDLDPDGHGTCVGSKVNGPRYGVAKRAQLVVVKAATDFSDTVDGLNLILEDVRRRKLQGKAVVSFSRTERTLKPGQLKTLKHYVGELIKEDVVWIQAAGNDFRAEVVDGSVPADAVNGYPPLLARVEDGAFPIVNVGAVDNNGRNARFSQGGSLVHVFAPGVQVQCAANGEASGGAVSQKSDGTSFAAPAVAGLAALLLGEGKIDVAASKGQVAASMKKMLMDMAWERQDGQGKVVYNGVTPPTAP